MQEAVTLSQPQIERTLAVSPAPQAPAMPIPDERRVSPRARLLALGIAALLSWGIVVLGGYAVYALVS